MRARSHQPELRHQSQLLIGATSVGMVWTLVSLAGVAPPELARQTMALVREWAVGGAGLGQLAGFGGAGLMLAAGATFIGGVLQTGRRIFGQGALALALPVAGPSRVRAVGGTRLDLAAPATTVLAPAAGRVASVREQAVMLKLDAGGFVRLERLAAGSIRVRVGEPVAAGAALALSGPRGLRLRARAHAWGGRRRLLLRGYVVHGNGGPQWSALGRPLAGDTVEGMAGGDELPLLRGRAVFAMQAEGAAAERFAGVGVAVLHGDGPTLEDERGGRLRLIDTPAGWQAEGRLDQGSPLLRLLRLGLAAVPHGRVAGMWWCAAVPEAGRGTRVFLSFSGDMEVTARVRSGRADLPRRVWLRFAPGRGLVEVRAEFAQGRVRFVQADVAPD